MNTSKRSNFDYIFTDGSFINHREANKIIKGYCKYINRKWRNITYGNGRLVVRDIRHDVILEIKNLEQLFNIEKKVVS